MVCAASVAAVIISVSLILYFFRQKLDTGPDDRAMSSAARLCLMRIL